MTNAIYKHSLMPLIEVLDSFEIIYGGVPRIF